MSTEEVEKWSEHYFGVLALLRTIVGLISMTLTLFVCLRVFEVI